MRNVKRAEVRYGEVYDLKVGINHGHSGWADGRVRVVSLLVANTDDAPAPYYEAVVRFVDPSHAGYRDLKLCGPQIDYHLWEL